MQRCCCLDVAAGCWWPGAGADPPDDEVVEAVVELEARSDVRHSVEAFEEGEPTGRAKCDC